MTVVGDACDRQTCGDSVQSYQEECDDGNLTSGDGCSDECVLEGAAAACANGADDDGDGLTDLADPGCTDASDASERGVTPCDDGIDNDGDGRVDFDPDTFADPNAGAGDIGCLNGFSLEDPQCSNDVDDNGNGNVDFDGGPFGVAPDGPCVGKPWRDKESSGGASGRCGLGGPLPLLLALAAVGRRLSRKRRS